MTTKPAIWDGGVVSADDAGASKVVDAGGCVGAGTLAHELKTSTRLIITTKTAFHRFTWISGSLVITRVKSLAYHLLHSITRAWFYQHVISIADC